LLARDKPLAKKLLAFHGIPSPRFRFFPVGQRVRSIGRLRFPLVVKAASEDASLGLSRASVVSTEAKLMSRVGFMHDHFGVDVLVEEYIEGRELNMGVLGNSRTTCLPPFELSFGGWPCGAPRIATERAKWSSAYQERYALRSGPASKLPAHTVVGMRRLALAAYRVLGLSGCARMDFRLAPDGKLFLLEANPNPDLAMDEDFAAAARQAGWDYPRLIQQLVALGLAWRPAWKRVEHGLSARVS
jgi:D-alanine-D-alanine ligase